MHTRTGTRLQGRAGRPQYDTTGVAVIMTQSGSRHLYHGAAAMEALPDVESVLQRSLIEHVAAEVALGNVVDVATATAWLRATFLYTRMVAAPQRYHMRGGATAAAVEDRLRGTLMEHLMALHGARCLRFELAEGAADAVAYEPAAAADLAAAGARLRLAPLRACHVFSRSYLRFDTFAILASMPPQVDVVEWFRRVAAAREYSDTMIIRREEKVVRATGRACCTRACTHARTQTQNTRMRSRCAP